MKEVREAVKKELGAGASMGAAIERLESGVHKLKEAGKSSVVIGELELHVQQLYQLVLFTYNLHDDCTLFI